MKSDVFSRAEAALASLPDDAAILLFVRHGEKEDAPNGAPTVIQPGLHDTTRKLTDCGKADAEKMGNLLTGKVVRIEHSDIPRCRQTAECMARGAQFDGMKVENPLLAGNGFVQHDKAILDGQKIAGSVSTLFYRLAVEDSFIGFNQMRTSVSAMLTPLLSTAKPGINVVVSHDWVIYLVLFALGMENKPFSKKIVGYLEPVFLWKEGERVMVHYRSRQGVYSASFINGMEKKQ